jgi:energy-coupling factor transport system ATP-binding protein
VGQDPLAGFVTDIVEDELAYGMEQLGVDPDVMRRRVEETLDLLGIVELRRRPLRALSGGQQQRVAIGSVLAMHPAVLVLDEPTSALDPTAAEEVLATLTRLVHDLDTTVVLAEHRLERVLPFVDRIVHVRHDGSVRAGTPLELLDELPFAPPIVELGRLAGWRPLPLTVRDARAANRRAPIVNEMAVPAGAPEHLEGDILLDARGVTVRHGAVTAVRDLDLSLRAGQVVAMLGRNGAGKSSLLWALQSSQWRTSGTVETSCASIALVPQTASDLLLYSTVEQECHDADTRAAVEPGTCRALLDELATGIPGSMHPRDLSAGSQLALVLAMQLMAHPRIVLLDEPTRGLDYDAKAALATIIERLAADGSAIVVATHDVEFAALVAHRALVLADGEIVTSGDATFVLGGSPAFAPQVTKVLGQPWLTVRDVRRALEVRA